MRTIAVIGAGITGVTTAYSLLKRGFDVTVFDRNRYAAMETSFANGGQLSASNAETWNQWGNVIKGMKWMFSNNAPLLFNPTPNWHKYSWMAEFVANIPHHEKNTIETVRLAIAARQHLLDHAKQEGFDFDLEQRGILHVYNNKKTYDHAERVNGMLAKGGLVRRPVESCEMKELEPNLSGEFYGGFYTESDFTGDIHRYARGLAKAAKRGGVAFEHGADVTRLNHSNDGITVSVDQENEGVSTHKFDGVVVCAGVGSRVLAAQLGDRVNVYPVKGYSITVNLDDEESQQSAPWTSLLDDEAKIVTSRLGVNRFRIAGTAEFNGYNKDIRDDRIVPLVKWCERLFPSVSTEHAVPWAGLRPMMPNMMPRVGAGKKPGVFYNTGHGHLGWTLSAATAEIAAENVLATARKNEPPSIVASQLSRAS